jgi:hypothetical protein
MEDMKMTHTAGPWKLIDEDGVYIAAPLGFEGDPTDRRVIANLWEPDENTEWLGDEDMANYRLMADAPELKTALEDMLRLIDEHGDRTMQAHATRIMKAREVLNR